MQVLGETRALVDDRELNQVAGLGAGVPGDLRQPREPEYHGAEDQARDGATATSYQGRPRTTGISIMLGGRADEQRPGQPSVQQDQRLAREKQPAIPLHTAPQTLSIGR